MPIDPDLTAAVAPDAVRAALRVHGDELATASRPHHPSALSSVREASHRGHEIVVRTTYSITVDGRPFEAHVTVDNAGRVHYHGMPTRDFASVVDLVTKAIDAFPDDFSPASPAPPDPGHAGHGEHQGHEEHPGHEEHRGHGGREGHGH